MGKEEVRLLEALEMYEMELGVLMGVRVARVGTEVVLAGRRRDLEHRIRVVRYCLEHPGQERYEC